MIQFKSKHIVWAIATLFPAALTAQNNKTEKPQESTVNQTVTVVRDYNPTVSDALKMESMPTIDDTTTYHPVFTYSILSRAFETANDIDQISAAKLAADEQPLLDNSLVRFGVGAYNTVLGEFSYNILQSKLYALGLSFGHTSSMGKVKLINNAKTDAPFHDTYASLGFKRFFPKVTLSGGMDFKHNMYRYYGFQTLNPLNAYELLDGSLLVTGDKLMVDKKQRLSQFNIGMGVSGNNTDAGKAQWDTWLNFSTFGNKTGVSQNRVDLQANGIFPVNSLNFLMNAQITSYKVNTPDTIGPMFTFEEKQISLISLKPRVGIKFNSGSAELGMLISSEMGRGNGEFQVAPHITGNLTVVEGIISMFGGITGHLDMNDDASIYTENPFISPDVHVKSSFYGIDLHGGLKGNFSNSTSFTARVDYSVFNDEHFYVNRQYVVSPVNGTPVYHFSNMFDVVYDDGTLLTVSGELLLKPSDDLNLRLFAKYNGWKTDNIEKAWYKPETEVGVNASYNINHSLTVDASLLMLGKRYASVPNQVNAEELSTIVDVNLGATYRVNKAWSFWGRINNAAAAKYQKWYGYPTLRLNGMVGASYSF
jgi:hypothetical protein